VWNLATEQVEQRISLQQRSSSSLALAPGGLTLATGDPTAEIVFWAGRLGPPKPVTITSTGC
jgi:hypothetical protein